MKCPKCEEGTLILKITHSSEGGRPIATRRCDRCGHSILSTDEDLSNALDQVMSIERLKPKREGHR